MLFQQRKLGREINVDRIYINLDFILSFSVYPKIGLLATRSDALRNLIVEISILLFVINLNLNDP